jgi:hypothetical protein
MIIAVVRHAIGLAYPPMHNESLSTALDRVVPVAALLAGVCVLIIIWM